MSCSYLSNSYKSNYDCTFRNNDNDVTATVDVSATTVAYKINDNLQSNTADGDNLVLNDNDDDDNIFFCCYYY